MGKKTTTASSKDWNDIYVKKTNQADMNEERGALYELLNLYGIKKHLNVTQRKGFFRYVPMLCARTVKLYVAGENIFETDNVISMQRQNKLTRALQKYFNIRDEFSINVQLKNYNDVVKTKTVLESVSQVGLANHLANSLWLNLVTNYSWGNVELFETEKTELGDNYITYNVPLFEKFDGDLEEKLKTIKKCFNEGKGLSQNIGGAIYDITVAEVIEVSLDIEGSTTSAIKVKGKKGEPVFFYISGKDSCAVVEENYRQDLGEMVFVKENRRLAADKYYLVNKIERKQYSDIVWTLETLINPEMFCFVSPHGVTNSSVLKDTGVHNFVSMEDFASIFKKGSVFSTMEKYNCDSSFSANLKWKLKDVFTDLVDENKVPYNKMSRVVNKFVEKKGILL